MRPSDAKRTAVALTPGFKTTVSWKFDGRVAAPADPVLSSAKTPTHATRAAPMIKRLMGVARASLPTSFRPRPLVFNSPWDDLPTLDR